MVGITVFYWDWYENWHFYKKKYRKSRCRKKAQRYVDRIKKHETRGIAIVMF